MDENEWIASIEAAKIASVSRDCILIWIQRYNIGEKIDGRWRINKKLLLDFLNQNQKKENA
jgi:hypothetical protein